MRDFYLVAIGGGTGRAGTARVGRPSRVRRTMGRAGRGATAAGRLAGRAARRDARLELGHKVPSPIPTRSLRGRNVRTGSYVI